MARPPRPRVVWKFLLLLRLSIYVVTHHIYPRASPPLYCTLLPQSSPVLPPGDLSFNSSTTHFLSLPSLLRPRRHKFKPPPLSLYSGHPPGGWLIALLLLSGDIESNPGPLPSKTPAAYVRNPAKTMPSSATSATPGYIKNVLTSTLLFGLSFLTPLSPGNASTVVFLTLATPSLTT